MSLQEICSDVDPALVKGVGFDATCSLVAVDTKGLPVTVSPSKGTFYSDYMYVSGFCTNIRSSN